MYDLFRFMVLRPPQPVTPGATIDVDHQSGFMIDLRNASHSPSPPAAMTQVAARFTQSGDFAGDPSTLAHWQPYQALIAFLLQQPPALSPAKLSAQIKNLFGIDPAKLVSEKGYLSDKRRIQDSLIALQLAAPPRSVDVELMARLCRLIDLIEREADGSLASQPDWAVHLLDRIIVLPPDLFPVPAAQPQAAPPQPPAPPATAEGADQPQSPSPQSDLLARAGALSEALRLINTVALQPAAPVPTRPATAQAAPATATASGQAYAATPAAAKRAAVSGGGIDPLALQALSPAARNVLSSLNLDLAATPPAMAAQQLNAEFANTMNVLDYTIKNMPISKVIGAAGGVTGILTPDPFYETPPLQEWEDQTPETFPMPPATPNPMVQPAGIADLLVVRQHVLGYEPGEIAFVENVAVGETLKRHTRRMDATESSTLTTTITSAETERDLQSTDRFALQRQTQSVMAEDSSVPGASSAAYGPLVDSSSKQSSSLASDYGQDVTRRAVSKLTTSQETQVLQSTKSEFEEGVEHDYNNAKGPDNQIVVYQWLDKIIQAKVFSYGKRMLYDFIVPEPAAFIVWGMQEWQPELAALKKPKPYTQAPESLSDDPSLGGYYMKWVTGFGATGVQPPPEPAITVSRTYGDSGKSLDGKQPADARAVSEVQKDNVNIPPGYQAQSAVIDVELVAWNDISPTLSIDIGGNFAENLDTSNTPVTLPLSGEVGEIPLTVLAWGPAVYTMTVEIKCVRTVEATRAWQLTTHDAILQASRDRMSEYENQLNTLKAALTVKVAGKSSDEKQALVRVELEKSCVTILSNQHFDAFNAIEHSPIYPQLYLPNVEPMGRFIRFFQQAFEWDQMLYRYYPYFWGRKKYWNDRLQLDDQDPDFAAFLGAGAARVTVPVRPGYEKAVAAYMSTGAIPTDAALLSDAVTTGLYVPFFAEMMGDTGPDTAVPYGDPPLEWEIRAPTTLVKVRMDNTLPKWAKGTWTPVNPGDSETP